MPVKFRKAAKVLAAGLFLMLAAEVFIRVRYAEPLKTRVLNTDYKVDSILGYVHKPNTRGVFYAPHFSKNILINSHGFDSRDFTAAKAPGYFRIAVVGASNENSAYVHGKPYSDLLHDLFEKQGYKVEVINCSLGGNGLDYTRVRYIRERLIHFKPDLVLLLPVIPMQHAHVTRQLYRSYVIDFDPDNKRSEQHAKGVVDELHRHSLLTSLYDASYIVRAVCKKINNGYSLNNNPSRFSKLLDTYISRRYSAKDQIKYVISVDKTVEVYKALDQFLAERGVRFFLINYFRRKELEQFLAGNGLPVLSLGIEDNPGLHWEYDGHMNDKAHARIAAELFARFTRGTYLPVNQYK